MSAIAKVLQKMAAPAAVVAKAIAGVSPAPPHSTDPFHHDLERRLAINAHASRHSGWLPRRPGWLRRWR